MTICAIIVAWLAFNVLFVIGAVIRATRRERHRNERTRP